MKITKGIIFLSILIGLGYSGYSWRRHSHAADVREEAMREKLAKLGEDVETLRTKPSFTPLVERDRVQQRVEGISAPESSHEPGTDAGTAEIVNPLVKQQQELDKTLGELNQRFGAEPVDRLWSEPTQHQIHDVVEKLGPSASVLDARCASTLCRVVLGHSTEEDQAKLSSLIAASAPFDQGTFYHVDHGTRPPQTTLFIVRDTGAKASLNN